MFSLDVEDMRLEPYKLNAQLLEEKLRKWITKVTSNQNFWKTKIHFVFRSGIEALEKKAFEVCDENGDGGLTWEEVEKCEVSLSINSWKSMMFTISLYF